MDTPLITCKKFEALTPAELYEILQLRSLVFVVEQNCVYLDADGKDAKSLHLCFYSDNKLVAYARLLPPGLSYKEASIGRVVSHKDHRKYGFGKLLMKEAIERTLAHYDTRKIRIGAQLYLKEFYEGFGFVQASPVYDEDGIEHIEMLLDKT